VIKREFNVPRTPQQNGIAERKNKTLIEAARTMLADSLLPISFWAKAVNTACYVQNRVLVTKPHNKTPYELLHGRTPSIGFMRPFGCPVTIFNTLEPLGKFQGKVDGGFLVGYSVCSKAFRVFNGRTCIIQETLHVNFLENKPNVASTGPTWLFDIDSLIRTMNYQPVTAGNQTNSGAGFQDKFAAEKAGEDADQTYVLFLVWSAGSTNPHNSDKDVAFDGKEHDFDKKKPESVVILSSSSSAQSRKQDDRNKKKDKRKSPIESFTGYRDLNVEFEDCSNNSSNKVNAAGPIVPTVGQNFLNSSNTFSPAGPSITAVSPSYGKSSFIDASKLLDDLDMPELEDITYSDDEDVVGVEADFNNLESSFQVSPIPTTRIHKDHPVSQIIGDLSLTTQTRSMTRAEEPKRVHQALKDPSWIEDMQEELLQLKMQKVWVLDDLPYGKRAIVARIEAIRLFLAYASFMGFMVYQMDVKSAFLYGTIKEEVYVCQPLGSEETDYPDKVYKVVKALYGLHQAPRAWYETLATYLLENADERQVSDEFYGGTHILLGSLASTPIDTEKPLLKDPDEEYVNCKKQIVVATSSTEAEYVAAASCYAQVLWIQNQLLDYGNQLGDVLTHTTKYTSPALTQKVFANMMRVGKGFLGVETPLFEGMLAVGVIKVEGNTKEQVQDVANDAAAHGADTTAIGDVVQEQSISSPTPPTPPPQQPQDLPSTSQRIDTSDDTVMEDASNQGKMIDDLDRDACVALMDDKEAEKKAEEAKVAGDDQVQGRQAEIYQIDLDHASNVLSMQEVVPSEVQEVVNVATTAKLITKVVTVANKSVAAASITISAAESQVLAATTTAVPSKDKGKGIMVEKPKPLKKKQQIEMDKEFARKLYQVIKKRPQTEAQAQKNMIMYLKNVDGFRLDYFKGMSYDDIRPIFKVKFNSNIEFLLKTKEQLEEEENRAIQSINETPAQKATKRKKLNKEVKDLKRHLEIMPDVDDDVYIEATPLARKVPVVDYEIIHLNNKPHYKIIQPDGISQLPDEQAQVWKNQRTVHGQARVKRWKLLESAVKGYKTTTSRRPTRVMVEYILHQAKEHDLDQATLELMLPWIIKKNTKCLTLLVKNLVRQAKVDVVGLVLLKEELMLLS
nr:retrovirus-related Pol polyprotein from transposon TNT 1-94 [Tanacetum cinerariifolium]